MATYKVLQDIEAEDKFLGPLTLKQFIFGSISLICVYLGAVAISRNFTWATFLLAPPAMISGFLAWPWGRDQPTETWLLAKIRFMFKPRIRLWNQSGIEDLVTITVPKKIEHNYTNGLSQTEVRSRLSALADTIDSRGWAVKNINVNLSAEPTYMIEGSDRLVSPSSLPSEVSTIDVSATDDILDSAVNPVAHHLEQLIQTSSANHRKKITETMQKIINQQADTKHNPKDEKYWFFSQPDPKVVQSTATKPAQPPAQPAYNPLPAMSKEEEEELSKKIHSQIDKSKESFKHMKTIKPLGQQDKKPEPKQEEQPPEPVTATPTPAIIKPATKDDLKVATTQNKTNKVLKVQKGGDEVVVSLH